MNAVQTFTWKRSVQLAVVLLGALALKLCYSTASPNQLRWILTPTTLLVELVSGTKFEFESYAGYINSDRSFLIAGSCAGVNFLVTAFLMLSLRRLWLDRTQNTPWTFLPAAALIAYVVTLLANTIRISTALRLRQIQLDTNWLSPGQLHRCEGIVIYFGFLLLLFLISERMSSESHAGLLRQYLFPLLIYYGMTLGVPLVNVVHRRGVAAADFEEHLLFVLLIPLLLILPLAGLRFYRVGRRRVVS